MSESKLPKKQVLDYSFARANGVLITTLDNESVIIHRASTTFEAILEARRVQAKPAVLKEVSNGEFETLAAQVYASSDLSISAEDAIGKSSDLNALADGIPKISDLLDTSDDAPVIRLINGVLQEASWRTPLIRRMTGASSEVSRRSEILGIPSARAFKSDDLPIASSAEIDRSEEA